MAENPKIKFSEDWREDPPTMLPGEIAVNTNTTPPTIFAGNNHGIPRPLPGIIVDAATPPRPHVGTMWIDSARTALKYWDGEFWVNLGGDGGIYDSGDFIGWMDPTLPGGGISPPIDQTNAAAYEDGAYVRMDRGGWYNIITGQPVDPSIGGAPAGVWFLAVGETVIKDSTSTYGWRQMEDGATSVGKLALHNFEDISQHWVGMQYEMVTLGDGSVLPGTWPLLSQRPVVSEIGDPLVQGADLIYNWVSHYPADTDIDQQQRALTLWPTGFVTQAPMDNWGDTSDPDRPEVPGNPGHLDLFPDWAFLPKATLLAEFGATNAIIKNPTGEYNTITPAGIDDYGLIIESPADPSGAGVPLVIKNFDKTVSSFFNENADLVLGGKLAAQSQSYLYGDVHFVDQTNTGRSWNAYVDTVDDGGQNKMVMYFGPDADTDPANILPSKLGVITGTVGGTTQQFTFTDEGRLWLPQDPVDDIDAVRLGYLKSYTDDGFIHKTGNINESADGEKTFTGKLRAAGSVASVQWLYAYQDDTYALGWGLGATNSNGINRGFLVGGDANNDLQIITQNAVGGTQRTFHFKANGRLGLPLDPSADMDAVTKRYVDDNFLGIEDGDGRYMNLTGSVNESADGEKTFTGKIRAAAGIETKGYLEFENINDPANKAWYSVASDAALNMLQFAPSDHASRLRVITRSAPGGSAYNFTFRENGYLELPRDPSANSHAVRLNYIKNQIVDDTQTHRGIRDINGGVANWIRSAQNGFLPYTSGGNSSSLGTSGWRWKNVFGVTGDFTNLLVNGQPFDSTGFMDLTTNQTAAGDKTFTGKMRVPGSLNSTGYIAVLNGNNTGKYWTLACSNDAEHYLGLGGGDFRSSLYIDVKDATGGTLRRFNFDPLGYLHVPRDATQNTHAVRRGWVYNNIVDESQTYRGIRAKSGSTSGWVRSPTSGFIPYTSGGASSSLGTSGWRWANIFGTVGNFSSTMTVGSDLYVNGTYIYGDNKAIVQYTDGWLRMNPAGQFSSGIYMGGGLLRHDGNMQFGANNFQFSRSGNYLQLRNNINGAFNYRYESVQTNSTWYGKLTLPNNGYRELDAATVGQSTAIAATIKKSAELEAAFVEMGADPSVLQYEVADLDMPSESESAKLEAVADYYHRDKVILALVEKINDLQAQINSL